MNKNWKPNLIFFSFFFFFDLCILFIMLQYLSTGTCSGPALSAVGMLSLRAPAVPTQAWWSLGKGEKPTLNVCNSSHLASTTRGHLKRLSGSSISVWIKQNHILWLPKISYRHQGKWETNLQAGKSMFGQTSRNTRAVCRIWIRVWNAHKQEKNAM